MVNTNAVRAAIEEQYAHRCRVYGSEWVTDRESGVSVEKAKVLADEVPCRVSFELSYALEQTWECAEGEQRVKLFVAPEVEIPCGCRIEVDVGNGKMLRFAFSGEAAVYPTHKEIRVKPLEKNK